MIWRSSYHRRIAQAADFGTAFISFVLAYFDSALWGEFLEVKGRLGCGEQRPEDRSQ